MRYHLLILSLLFSSLSYANTEKGEVILDDKKWKVVNYWAQWCGPCRKEIPELNKLSSDNTNNALQVLGVDFDDHSHAKTLAIAKKMGIEFSILKIDQVEKLDLPHPVALPCTYILSPDNQILKVMYGEQTQDSLLKTLSELNAKI